jgi:large repetitive protein
MMAQTPFPMPHRPRVAASFVVGAALVWTAVSAPLGASATRARPIISHEYPGPDPVVSSAADLQTNPAAAWGTTSSLVVWQDDRDFDPTLTDIYAARVTADGTVLDVSGIPIATAPGSQLNPDVAFDGTNFLVVWQDGDPRFDPDPSIMAARVSQDGDLLDAGILVSSNPSEQTLPSVAWDGETYLVGWEDGRNDDATDLYGTRIAPDGTVLDPAGLLLFDAAAPDFASQPRLEWGGSNYLMAWQEHHSGSYPDILAERLDADGQVLDASPIVISANGDWEGDGDPAAGGGLFFVTFTDLSYDSSLRGVRVTFDGQILDDPSIAIAEPGFTISSHPRVAWDGRDFVAAWADDTIGTPVQIHAGRISADGIVLDPEEILVSTTASVGLGTAVAGTGAGALVSWADERDDTPSDVYGARLDQDGMVLDPDGILVSTVGSNDTTAPAVATSGKGYLMAWEDHRFGYPAIFVTRLTPSGQTVDGAGIPVATSGWDEMPAVAWDGTDYLVVWSRYESDGFDVLGTRIGTDGVVLDDPPISISTASRDQTDPTVAFDGENYLVAWTDQRADELTRDIYGTRVSPAGTVLDAAIPISTAPNRQTNPAVASDGSEFLVVWQSQGNGLDIVGSRVSSDGVVMDPRGIRISTGARDQTRPTVTWDGMDFMAAWADLRSGVDLDVYASRVSTDGIVLDPDGIPVSMAVNDQDDPAAAWDGLSVLICWTDLRAGASWDVVGARVARDGTILDLTGRKISGLDSDETKPAVVKAVPGKALVAYQRVAPEQPYDGSDRMFFRFFSER